MPNIEIKLKVMEAVQDDVNKGIVKIDSSFMKQIGVNVGDIVEIKGERITAAIVDRAYPGDIGLNIIRMDGNIRRNAKTSIGEVVTVTKVEVKPAKKVSIAPAHKGVMIKASPELFKQGLLGKAVVKGDVVSLGRASRKRYDQHGREVTDIFSMMEQQLAGFAGFGFGDLKFVVIDTNPKKEIVVVTPETEVEFNFQAVELKEEEESGASLGINYEDIGGLKEEIRKVQEMVELPLRHPEIFEKLGIEAPKGLLLYGPPGTGKTLLAKAVASETNSHFILINGPEVISKFYGESEKNLRDKFEEAEKNAPSIIFFDEIDAIATKREEAKGDVEKRVVAQLLGLMDGLKSRGKVIVIAATNMPQLLDPALRRPGRFDREIEIGVPDKEGRLEILQIHSRNMPIEGSLYPDVVKKLIPLVIDEVLASYQLKIKEKENEINNTGAGAGNDINALEFTSFINDLQKNIFNLQRLKKELESAEVPKLTAFAEEIIMLDGASQNLSLDDPRRAINENKKSDWYKELDSCGLLEPIKRKSRQDKKSINRDLESIARITHGFVGADISALSKEAAMIVLRRILPVIKLEGKADDATPFSKEILEKLVIKLDDFQEALKTVRPSAMREVFVEKPDVSWKDVGGLDEVKNKIKEAVEWPLKNPEMFKRMGIRPPRGILLYGPPGTGKTMLAKAVAKESEANFILINGPSLLSKWVGESEKAVREIFRKARQTAPTIMFFDEIDALFSRRGSNDGEGGRVSDKLVNQMLSEMDGLESLHDVVIIGASNRPILIDPALLRQGRFDRIIYTPVPDEESRKMIFEVHLSKVALDPASFRKDTGVKGEIKNKVGKVSSKKKELDSNDGVINGMEPGKKEIVSQLSQELAKRTEGYVGADIEGVCREAAMIALREDFNIRGVKKEHFIKALEVVPPSIDKETEEAYKELKSYFSSARAKQIKEEKAGYVG